jgi:coenzyme F420-reducing hydrogenase alpha subunit
VVECAERGRTQDVACRSTAQTGRPGVPTWLIRQVNLITATGQNNLTMNRTMARIARQFVKGAWIPEGVLNRLEAGIRAFDPCLSCATHAVV